MLKSHHRLYFCFFLFASITGAFYSRLPDIQSALGVNAAELGMTLIGAAIGSLISLTLCSPLIERFGVKRTAFVTVIGSTCFYALVAFLDNGLLAFASLFIAGLFAGALEVNLNVELGRLEAIQRRSMMSRAHGFWSLGFFITSLLAAGIRQLEIPATWHLGVAFIVVTATAIYMISGIVPSPVPPRAAGDKVPLVAMPTLALMPLCLIGLSAFLIEGAGVDWSAIYMRDAFHAAPFIGGLGITLFALVMTIVRLFIGPLVDRWSPRLVVTILLVVCIAGLVSVWLAPHPYVALAGFGLLGGGASAIYPLVLSAAAQRHDRAAALNVAAVSQISFVVFFLAPPLLGFVAFHWGIRESYLVCLPLMIASLFAVRSLPTRGAAHAPPRPAEPLAESVVENA